MAEVTITGLNEVIKKLGKLATLDILEAPMERSMNKIEERMKTYPPPPAPGEWAANTTLPQRRAFFAALRAGRIRGSRTGTLGRRWTHVVIKTPDGLEGHVGTNVPYAPFVQSRRFQARFHQRRWQTAEDVVESLRNEIVEDFQDTVTRALKG